MRAAWIAVACAEHVRRGREGGFMQVCHGKAAPLRRLRPGDGVVYYSPTLAMGDKRPYRAFTATGHVAKGEPFVFDMGGGFQPWRRPVCWSTGQEVSIAPLLPRLSLTAGRKHWGQALRFGLLEITAADFAVIGEAMG